LYFKEEKRAIALRYTGYWLGRGKQQVGLYCYEILMGKHIQKQPPGELIKKVERLNEDGPYGTV
jgi:hypothetical protein